MLATRHSAVRARSPGTSTHPHHPLPLTDPGLRAAHHACAVVALVLTSGQGEVPQAHRKLGSGATQNSEKSTEPRPRYPGNARPTGSARARLRNRGEAGVPVQTAPPATEKAAACGELAPLPRACAARKPPQLRRNATSMAADPRSREPTEVFPHRVLPSSDFLAPASTPAYLVPTLPCPALPSSCQDPGGPLSQTACTRLSSHPL